MAQCNARASGREAALAATPLSAASFQAGFELGRFWHELVAGEWKAESLEYGKTHVSMYVSAVPASRRSALPAAELGVLRRILLGEPQKVIAMTDYLSCSSISATNHRALARLGLPCCIWNIPVLLFMAAHEAHGLSRPAAARLSFVGLGQRKLWEVSAPWPDAELKGLLSRAELAVARLSLSGYAHHEIAHVRRASPRTVANQLSSVFRKAGVSGRTELVCKLLRKPGDDPCLPMHAQVAV
ncbi:MAG: helix-turn-helix transcriptional regulator [Myxococcota bacterium]|nr:helix-turn-helix transcriptional regulator [Myxococcota bacterium]